MRSALGLPKIVLLIWLAITSALLWFSLAGAIEPPAWDSLSYVQKSFLFWQSVQAGPWINPLNLAPTLRPPGSVLMSYPFGFDPDFHGFYFRASFIPMLLYIGAVLVACALPQPSQAQQWAVVALAVVLAGMPLLFQFQPNDLVPWDVTWGMVDNFLAALSACAAAAVLRSIKTQSIAWLCVAALFASLGFMVKPSGLLVMALIAASWLALLLWDAQPNAEQKKRFLIRGALAGAVIYGLVLLAVQQSQYFSAENILFGNRALDVMASDNPMTLSLAELEGMMRISLGYPVMLIIAVGFVLACARKSTLSNAVVAVACLGVGVWFWYFKSQPWEPRYFVPFAAMAFILVAPTLLRAMSHLGLRASSVCFAVLAMPAMATTAMLAMPSAPQAVQRALGINLEVKAFTPEIRQAEILFKALQNAGVKNTAVYSFNITSPLRSFQAVLNYQNLIQPLTPNVQFFSPIDWQRPNAFRFDDLASAEYLIFEPVQDEKTRQDILQKRLIKDFYEEASLMNAWATTLGENDGVVHLSESSLRLIRVEDKVKFEVAFDQFVGNHDWPKAFVDGNPQRWWSASDLERLKSSSRAVATNIALRGEADNNESITIPAVIMSRQPTSVDVDVWLSADSMLLSSRPWTLFGHLVDEAGTIYGNAQFALSPQSSPYPDRPFRRMTLRYNLLEPKASGVAIGVFAKNGEALNFMRASEGQRDWDGRRVILPLPSP